MLANIKKPTFEYEASENKQPNVFQKKFIYFYICCQPIGSLMCLQDGSLHLKWPFVSWSGRFPL